MFTHPTKVDLPTVSELQETVDDLIRIASSMLNHNRNYHTTDEYDLIVAGVYREADIIASAMSMYAMLYMNNSVHGDMTGEDVSGLQEDLGFTGDDFWEIFRITYETVFKVTIHRSTAVAMREKGSDILLSLVRSSVVPITAAFALSTPDAGWLDSFKLLVKEYYAYIRIYEAAGNKASPLGYYIQQTPPVVTKAIANWEQSYYELSLISNRLTK